MGLNANRAHGQASTQSGSELELIGEGVVEVEVDVDDLELVEWGVVEIDVDLEVDVDEVDKLELVLSLLVGVLGVVDDVAVNHGVDVEEHMHRSCALHAMRNASSKLELIGEDVNEVKVDVMLPPGSEVIEVGVKVVINVDVDEVLMLSPVSEVIEVDVDDIVVCHSSARSS
eukprot:4905032-Amphidinium_carterae.1